MSDLWVRFDTYAPADFVAAVDAAVAELRTGSGIGLFERACAQDSTGHPEAAVALYKGALDAGLTGIRRRRAVIQMASSLRNLGQPAKSVAMLTAELNAASDELDGAVRAFLALALGDIGREREALAISLSALSHYLPRYNSSLARYAQQLAGEAK